MCHLEHDCIAYWLHIVIYILLEKFWLFLQILYSLFVECFKCIMLNVLNVLIGVA